MLRFRTRMPRDDGTRQVHCTVRAVDAITNRPIVGASVRLWYQVPLVQLAFFEASPRPASRALTATTSDDGTASVPLRLAATLRHPYFLPERRVILGPDLMVEVAAPGYAPSTCPLGELLGSQDFRVDALPMPTLLVMLQPQSRLVMAGDTAAWPAVS